jgi:hypothetical protein
MGGEGWRAAHNDARAQGTPAIQRQMNSPQYGELKRKTGDAQMLDLIFVTLTIIFFLLALAYVRGCEKLQ